MQFSFHFQYVLILQDVLPLLFVVEVFFPFLPLLLFFSTLLLLPLTFSAVYLLLLLTFFALPLLPSYVLLLLVLVLLIVCSFPSLAVHFSLQCFFGIFFLIYPTCFSFSKDLDVLLYFFDFLAMLLAVILNSGA